MRIRTIACTAVLLAALGHAGTALAQYDYIAQVLIETECLGGGAVRLTVDVNLVTELPPNMVGWVIERDVLGLCWPTRDVGGVRPVPAARDTVVIVDELELTGYQALYFAYAVMASGERQLIAGAYRTHWAQADCLGGPAARGVIVELSPGWYHLDVCPDECWWELSSFDGDLPPEAPLLVGATVNLYGELVGGMEGPFIQMTDWEVSTIPCLSVPAEPTGWGSLKASYR